MTRLLLALVAGLIISTSAYAEGVGSKNKVRAEQQDPVVAAAEWIPQWSGLFVGVNAGMQNGFANVSVQQAGFGSLGDLNGLGLDRNWIGGVDLGASWRIKGTPFVLIALAGYQRGETELNLNITGMGSVLNASVNPTWKAGGGLGYLLNNNVMVYGGYQYARGELSVSSPGNFAISKDLKGDNVLVGLQVPITPSMDFSIQYDYTMYDRVMLADFGGGTTLHTDIDTHAVTARLKLKLPAIGQ